MAVEVSCSFVSEDSPCGLLGIGSTLVPLQTCSQDMTAHLVSLQVTSKRGRGKTGLSEKELILNRAGLMTATHDQTEAMTICPKHRRSLTTDWQGRKSSSCTYPIHNGQRKQLKSTRRVNALMSAEIHRMYNALVPIGSGKFLPLLFPSYKIALIVIDSPFRLSFDPPPITFSRHIHRDPTFNLTIFMYGLGQPR